MSDFDLLGDPTGDSPPPSKRPTGLLVGGLVVVVLLALVGVGWMVSSVSGRGGTVTAGATPTPTPTTAPATTAEPTTEPPPTTPAAATTTVPVPTRTTVVPLPTALTVAPVPTTARPTPKPPIVLPVPKPTVSAPGGKLVPVPGVIGLRVKAASKVLRTAGFTVQVLGGIATPDRDDRRVIAQRPTPGTVVRAGSTVILVTDGI